MPRNIAIIIATPCEEIMGKWEVGVVPGTSESDKFYASPEYHTTILLSRVLLN